MRSFFLSLKKNSIKWLKPTKKQKMTNLKFYVQGKSEFQYYKDSQLWYKTQFGSLVFPVPIEDVGTATFNRIEKSSLMMRYIRKHIEVINKGE